MKGFKEYVSRLEESAHYHAIHGSDEWKFQVDKSQEKLLNMHREVVEQNKRYRELLKECRGVSLDVVKYARLADEPKLYGLSKKISETLEDDTHA